MPEKEYTVHCAVVWRSKKNPGKHMMTTHILRGKDLDERMKTIVTVDANSWANEWELVSFSHAFLPY